MIDSYEEAFAKLEEMRSRYQSGFSHSDRQYIEQLHTLLFGVGIKNRTCGDCFRDAFIENYNYLKKTNKMPQKNNFILKAGALLRVPFTNKSYVNPVKDADAIAALAAEPKMIFKFAEYPEDWEEMVKQYKAQEANKTQNADEEVKALQELKELREAYDELKDEHMALQKNYAEKLEHIKNLEDTITKFNAPQDVQKGIDAAPQGKKSAEKKNAE